MVKRGIVGSRKDELVEIGMNPFEDVFSIFIKDPENLSKTPEYFFQYYRWWMRQTLTRYLNP
ncbi:hypothetical protein X744_22435 [Mesorhizobium sp. LNJC372A00]|nr:hypothetical protein X744_22435 [Mesorhizobium sp. LNJC372A00]